MTRFKPFQDEAEEQEGGRAVPDSNSEAQFCFGITALVVILCLLAYIGANIYDASPVHRTPLEFVGMEVFLGALALSVVVAVCCLAATMRTGTRKLDDAPMWIVCVSVFILLGVVALVAALLALDSKTFAADVGVVALLVSFCACFCYVQVLVAYDPGRTRNKQWPRSKRDKWGSIAKQVSLPAENVEPSDSWLSVLLMWVTLPISLVVALVAVCSPRFSRSLALKCKGSSRRGRPLVDAPLWWVYSLYSLLNLVKSGSRLAYQINERKKFGDGTWFWQSEGAWACTYERVDELARSQQRRGQAFAATTAVVPEMFPSGLLIFLSNFIAKTKGERSEWEDIREVLHTHFLSTDLAAYKRRVGMLAERLAADWPEPSMKDLSKQSLLMSKVAKCIFFVTFGIWVTDEEANTLARWKKVATLFVLPRMVHRFLLNMGLVRMQTLREETIAIIRKYKLESVFFAANDALYPRYQRATVAQLADEFMFVFCFAGIIGTASGAITTAAALHGSLGEVPDTFVQFEQSPDDLLSLYRADPESFIKEALRLDPPVTSATSMLRDDLKDKSPEGVGLVNRGEYEQYVLALANRDPAVFDEPQKFNPQRPNLNDALTWNGRAFAPDEAKYPRICPGRHLAMTVIRTVIDHGLSAEKPSA